MPSTYTLNNGIELIATGEQSGTWGDTTNTNLELLDTALDGQVTVTLASAGTSGSPNSLPISDGTASNGRNRMVIFDDSSDLGATAYVQLTPNDAEKIIYVRNSLSGSRSILLFQGTYNASNDYELKAGTTAVIFFDGAGSGAVAANVLSDLQVEKLSVFGTAPTITLTDTDTGVDTELNAASSVGQFTLNIDKNNEGSSPRLVTQISGTEFFRINESGAVFNESSNDQDFRVESNNDTHMLFVDASTSRIGLITSAPAYTLDVLGQGRFRTSDSSVELTVESTDTTAAQGAKIILNHNKTAADGDVAGYIDFKANNDGASEHLFGRIQVDATDVSAGSEDGRLRLSTLVNGSTFEAMRITTGTVFNEGGIDADFRVEGDTNTHALFVDAGNDRVGINTSTVNVDFQVGNQNDATDRAIAIAAGGSYNKKLVFRRSTSDDYVLVEDSSENLSLNGSVSGKEFVINNDGIDLDFRVEGDTNTHLFFVDAGQDEVSMGTSANTTYDAKVAITVDNSSSMTDFQASLLLNDDTEATSLSGGSILFGGQDGTSSRGFAKIAGGKANSTSGDYGGSLMFRTRVNGDATMSENMRINGDGIVINETSQNKDFRVEADSYSDAIFLDASTGKLHFDNAKTNFGGITDATADGEVNMGLIKLRNSNTTSGEFLSIDCEGTTAGQSMTHYWYDGAYRNRLSVGGNTNVTVVNESGLDVDFRIESDGQANMLVVNGAENCVSVGTSDTSVSGLHVVSSGAGTAAISARGNGAANGMVLFGDRYTDDENQITLGVGYANATAVLARGCKPAPTGTNGFVSSQDTYNNRPAALTVQDGGLRFYTTTSSSTTTTNSAVTLYNYFEVDQGETTFNEDSINQDFRVETDASAYGFFVDAGTGYLAARGASQVRFTLGSAGTSGGNNANWIRGSGNALGLNAASDHIHFEIGGTEFVRIASGGTLNIGTTAASGASGNTGVGMTNIGRTISNCDTDWNYEIYGAQTGRLRLFSSAGGGTQVGSITVSTSATSYNTSSDYRLKENVVELTSATERLKQLQPKRFNFIAEAETTVDGFLAHEVSSIVPEAITGEKDAVHDDGTINPQSIDQSKLVPLLVATIKELEARITALENA